METKEIKKIETEANELLKFSQEFKIKTDEDFKVASEHSNSLSGLRKKIVAFFKPHKDNAFKAHKDLCADEKEKLNPVKEAEQVIDKKITAYRMEQQRKIDAENERLRKIQEEKERKEKEKAEEERKKQEEIDRQLQEDIDEEERKRLQKEKDKSIKKEEKAEQKAEDAATTIVAPKKVMPKVEGQTMVDNWCYEVIDINLLPPQFKMEVADEVLIKAKVKAMKGQIKIPGVRIFNKPTLRKKS